MQAAMYDRYGPAREVLRVAAIERPQPDPGEVRVRMHVSAVNPTDWRVRSGSQGTTPPFPYMVPNQDGAGVIDAVGAGVSEALVGHRVWVYFAAHNRQHGTAAQWLCLPQHQAVPLPDGASLDLGASLGIPALTAHVASSPTGRSTAAPCSSRAAQARSATSRSSSAAAPAPASLPLSARTRRRRSRRQPAPRSS